eukprot:s2357_g17.t1
MLHQFARLKLLALLHVFVAARSKMDFLVSKTLNLWISSKVARRLLPEICETDIEISLALSAWMMMHMSFNVGSWLVLRFRSSMCRSMALYVVRSSLLA